MSEALKIATDALHRISLGAQNSGETKENLGAYARGALANIDPKIPTVEEHNITMLEQRAFQAESRADVAMEQLIAIFGLLSPPDVTVGDKAYEFHNPEIEHIMLRDLSRKIREIPLSLRSGATALAADRYKYLREQAGQQTPQATVLFRDPKFHPKFPDVPIWVNVWDGKSLDEAVDQRRIMGILKREPK